MNEPEEWRDIEGFPGYEVSDLGRGRSPHGGGRILKSNASKAYGYQVLYLGRGNQRYVHRLVAAAFLGPIPEDKEVDHRDTNPRNNRVTNLRYLTHAENLRAHREHTTHCPKGHSLEDAYWCPRGKRNCRGCRREASRRSKQKKAAAA